MLQLELSGRWVLLGSIGAALAAVGCSSSGSGGGSGAAAGSAGSGAFAGSGASAGSGAVGGSGASAGSGGVGASAGTGGASSGGSAGTGASAGTGGTGGGGGVELCGNNVDDNGNGYKDCDDSECFSDAACIATDLSNQKMAGYTLCGKAVTFTNVDSDQVCQNYPPFSFPDFGSKCQFATYSGTITFYCAPTKDAIGVRWVVQTQVPFETINGKYIVWENIGGEFQFLSGGGSTMGPQRSNSDIVGNSALHEHFVGYEKLDVKADTKGTLTEWFALWASTASIAPQVAGGFSVEIDAAALFSGK